MVALIKYKNENNEIKVFPNPFSNHLHIAAAVGSIKDITLIDFSGKEIRKVKVLANKVSLHGLGQLQSGLYVIRVTMENGETVWHKFLKS